MRRLELFLMVNCISGAHVKLQSSEKEKENRMKQGQGQGGQRQLVFTPAVPEPAEKEEGTGTELGEPAAIPTGDRLRVDVGLDQVYVDDTAPDKLYIDKIPDALCFNYVGRIR